MTPKEMHRWAVLMTTQYIKRTISGGVFIECGVKHGTSSYIMASCLQREGHLFDTWEGFPHYSSHDYHSQHRKQRLDKRIKRNKSIFKSCRESLRRKGVLPLCNLHKGDICKTIPNFVKNNTQPVCLLHIDTDLYEPAFVSLSNLFDRILPNGIILFHDYGDSKWPGIKQVVDDFVVSRRWGFVDINPILKVHLCALVNGDPSEYSNELIAKINLTGEFNGLDR